MFDIQKLKGKLAKNQEVAGSSAGATALGTAGLVVGPKIGIAALGTAVSGATVLPVAGIVVGALAGYAAIKAIQARKTPKSD